MRRHVAPFFLRCLGYSSLKPRLILLTAAVAFLLGALPAFSQDTAPPAPPPDQNAGQSAASPAPAAGENAGNPNLGPGQTTVRAVRISDVEGQVQVFENGEVAFDQALPNMPVVEGMRLVAGDNGRLEIEFEDGSVVRVTPDSSIRLSQLRRNADGSTVTVIDALTGLSYYELNEHGGQYSVHFGSDTAAPIQDAVFRVSLDSSPYQLAVMHGSAHVDDGGGLSVDVKTNQTFQTDPQQPGEFTLAQNVAADSWDQWNSSRDQALSSLEDNQTVARASSGDPNNPAWNDLDAYGNWYDVPGYGNVWAPSGVSSSWDPFGNGAWGYYPGFGYTWISGYPWGWMPYHCGAWNFMNSFGWGWVPGNCGAGLYGPGWYPYATVWNVPPGYIPPPRPHGTPAPVRRIGTGPVGPRPVPPAPRLVAVNRGEQFSKPFVRAPGVRPQPRVLTFQGKSIQPLGAGIHPIQRGPVGESFTSALVRTHPELGGRSFGARSTLVRPQSHTFGAPRTFGGTVGRGGYTPGIVNHSTFGGGGYHGAASAGGGFHGGNAGGAAHAGGGGFGGGGGGHVGGGAPSGGGGGAHH